MRTKRFPISIPRTVVSACIIAGVIAGVASAAIGADAFDRQKPSNKVTIPPPITSVRIKDGHLLVNDRPFFPLGVSMAAHWHLGLKDVGEKGFNMVNTAGSNPDTYRIDIDNAYANGMYSEVSLNGICEDLAMVEKVVLKCRNAPGLLAWQIQDEINAMRLPEPKDKPYRERPYQIPPEKVKLVYNLIKRLDPLKRPVWVNLCHGWAEDHAAYQPVVDIMSADPYPVPAAPLPMVAFYTDVTKKGCAGKPLWMTLQMSKLRPTYAGDRPPTITEARCMTYMAIAHGASGVTYYSFNEGAYFRASHSDPAYWSQWADLTAELRTLTPYILSPEITDPIKVVMLEGQEDLMLLPWGFAALHLSLRKTENGWFLIAVNGINEKVRARLTLPFEVGIPQGAVRFENRTINLEGNTIEDTWQPYQVHLYELAKPIAVPK